MYKYFFIVAIVVLLPIMTPGQQSDDTTRDLWDTAFLKKRPAGKIAVKRTRPVRYKAVGTTARVTPSMSSQAVVGVTIWQMRPSKKTDDEEVRQIIHQEGEWTPERVAGGEILFEGSKIQLTIESPRSGYLYVFNREIYADKTFGVPYLIFPTLSLNGGDNQVSAGRVIEIPSQDDKPPYYTLTRSRPDHNGESLTVIVSDKPLPDLVIGRTAQKVSFDQFDSYETKWGALFQQLELESGAGTAMNKAEKAALRGTKSLTQQDSLPQTIYQVMAKPGHPLLLTIPLAIKAKVGNASETTP